MSRSGAKNAKQQSATSGRELLFVEVDIDGKKRSKQARAHVARVIRQRQKQERLKSKGESNGQLTRNDSSESSSSSTFTIAQSTVHDNSDSGSSTPSTATARRSEAPQPGVTSRSNRELGVSPLRRTIAPVFGALKYDAFTSKESIEAAEIASYCFGPVMNSWLDPRYKPTWISAFFTHPLVYHSLSFSVGILMDVASNRSIQPRRLMHQIRTIQLVNQQLDQLDTVDHEPIMLAIISLWRINIDEIAERRMVPLLFTPHLRQASFIATFGKLGGDGSHPAALLQLVNRIGGLGQFKTLPSLQESLALADVLDSSANATPPRFGQIWDTESFLQQLKPALAVVSSDVEGRGFFEKVPGGLTVAATTAFQRLSYVDKLLDDYSTRNVTQNEDFYLAALANAAQHEVLSLPPWSKLPEKATHTMPSYEACRITALLYSNCVIFPISSSSAWLEKLLRKLRELIELPGAPLWRNDNLPLLIWALVIGGIAAFWTGHRSFFLDMLRQALQRHGASSLDEIRPTLQLFLWRDSTCMKGALTLWDFLKVNEESVGPDTLQTILRSDRPAS